MSLKDKIGLFTDKTFMKFVIVGVVNTVVGTAIMFVFYNVFQLSYWVSSASNYSSLEASAAIFLIGIIPFSIMNRAGLRYSVLPLIFCSAIC